MFEDGNRKNKEIIGTLPEKDRYAGKQTLAALEAKVLRILKARGIKEEL